MDGSPFYRGTLHVDFGTGGPSDLISSRILKVTKGFLNTASEHAVMVLPGERRDALGHPLYLSTTTTYLWESMTK